MGTKLVILQMINALDLRIDILEVIAA